MTTEVAPSFRQIMESADDEAVVVAEDIEFDGVVAEVWDKYPDVQYYAAFLQPGIIGQIQAFVDRHVPPHLMRRLKSQPLHITISHRRNTGTPEVCDYVRSHFDTEVQVTLTRLVVTQDIAYFEARVPFPVATGRPHMTVRLAEGVSPTHALEVDANKAAKVEECEFVSPARIQAWSFSQE